MGRRPGLPSITTLTLLSSLFSHTHALSASFNHPTPASHPPLLPLLSSYKSISSPSIPPLAFSHLLPPAMPRSLCTPNPSPSFHRWECSGNRKVRGGQTRGRGQGIGNEGVWKWEWVYLIKVVWSRWYLLCFFWNANNWVLRLSCHFYLI